MKKNAGFMLFETLVVSTLILGTLIFLYIQLSSIINSYYISFRYNTIPGLYNGNTIASYISKTGYDSILTSLGESQDGYVDITDCTGLGSLCEKIIIEANINKVFFTQNNIETLKTSISNASNINNSFKKYISKLPTITDSGKYRLIIEYNDETYSSVEVEEDVSEKVVVTINNIITNSSFDENTVGWTTLGNSSTLSTSTTAKASPASGIFTTSDNNENTLKQNVILKSNHTYYVRQDVYLNNEIANNEIAFTNIYLNESNNYNSTNFAGIKQKKWTTLSSIFTPTTDGSYSYNAISIQKQNIINIDNVMLIDLTADFGSGDEPDKDWCDSHIKYFNVTTRVYK